jgi:hypothetical protein
VIIRKPSKMSIIYQAVISGHDRLTGASLLIGFRLSVVGPALLATTMVAGGSAPSTSSSLSRNADVPHPVRTLPDTLRSSPLEEEMGRKEVNRRLVTIFLKQKTVDFYRVIKY